MKLFKKSKIKKRKFNGLKTLDDCKKYYLENPDYRYVLVVGKEKSPYSICKTIEVAREDIVTIMRLEFDAKPPMEIIDLLYEL